MGGFTLISADIVDGKPLSKAQVHHAMGAGGENVSPQLAWSGAPAGTKSFALTVYDPDAPTGSGWWHWTVANIPADGMELPRGAGGEGGALPPGATQTRTDFGVPGYGGAAPPPGDPPHRYQFTVYALDVDKLDVGPDSSAAMLGFNIHFHKLGEARIVATYGR